MSLVFTDAQLNDLFEEIPALAGRPRQLEELSGGLTNRNVKITTPDGVYVARCTDAATQHAGYRPRPGALQLQGRRASRRRCTEWSTTAPISGSCCWATSTERRCATTTFNDPACSPRPPPRCRRCTRDPGSGPLRHVRTAAGVSENRAGQRIPHSGRLPRPCRHVCGESASVLTATDQTTVPCNNDLLAGNFVEDGDKMWLIDYEYSGNNDPCFELGNTWSECGLSTDQLDELVTAYYGKRLRHKIARAHLQGIVAKYGWTLWGCIQNGSSAIEFDFWDWAMERYDAASPSSRARPRPAARRRAGGRLMATSIASRPRTRRHHRRRRHRHQRRLPPDQARLHRRRPAASRANCRPAQPGTPPDWSASCAHPRAQHGWCSTPPSSTPNSKTRPACPPATSSAGE